MQYQLSRVVAGPFLRLLWRPQITGLEHIPPEGGAILASNHLSIVDSIFLPLMLDRPLTFAAKSEYFTGRSVAQRLAGTYLRATKQLSVDRAQARAAQDMLEAALALLRSGQLFGIYPEGTRSPDGRLYRGRTGVAWLALNSGLPVIPVAMIGTDRILPPGHAVPRPASGDDADRQAAHVRGLPGEAPRARPAARSPTRSSRPSRTCPARSTCPCTRRSARRS